MRYALLLFAVLGLLLFGCLQQPPAPQQNISQTPTIQPTENISAVSSAEIIGGINESEGDFPLPA